MRDQRRSSRRTRLLDAAEQRFSEVGYEATAIRDVTTDADTRLAAINEEFGNKEQLFREVMIRRALPLEAAREERLAMVPAVTEPLERLRGIVDAFVQPMLERAETSTGWRNYFRFIAQMAHSRHVVSMTVADEYNRVARAFIEALGKTYPRADEQRLYDSYLFMLSSTLDVFADSRRLDSLSEGRYRSSELRERCRALNMYVIFGIHGLLDKQA